MLKDYIDEIIWLRKEGCSYRAIGEFFDCSYEAIRLLLKGRDVELNNEYISTKELSRRFNLTPDEVNKTMKRSGVEPVSFPKARKIYFREEAIKTLGNRDSRKCIICGRSLSPRKRRYCSNECANLALTVLHKRASFRYFLRRNGQKIPPSCEYLKNLESTEEVFSKVRTNGGEDDR